MNPMIIPVFLPHLGCQERCLFCNQKINGKEPPSPSSVRNFVETSLSHHPSHQVDREKQVAFYGGSFTAIQKEDQIRYLKEVQPLLASGQIHSIRISTRPDALDEEVLLLLKKHGVKTVEIGAQSMVDQVLIFSRRGHSVRDTLSSVSRLKRWGFEVGLHLMIGLPGDTLDCFLQSLDQVIDLRPDFLRIHPTLVLKGAPLMEKWKEGTYSPLSLEEAIQWLKRGLLKLERASISVARIGLQPTKELEKDFLTGPFHPALHQLIDSNIAFDMASQLLRNSPHESSCVFLCHPKEISNLRGQKNQNILKLQREFGLNEILVKIKDDLPRTMLILQTSGKERALQRKELFS